MTSLPVELVEASIIDLHQALSTGRITSVELTTFYLDRIEQFDRSGPMLNSMPIRNPGALREAAASDDRRRQGAARGILDGIPWAVKDNFAVQGLTVAAGSPAFRDVVAREDAFVVAQLRAAGAVLLGKTNMPPLADGGMQRGLYGRSESPYNPDYLAAAFGSGSSHGSAVATAANLCAFALGTETVSSGRSPASNNALVAYTPSRGIISVRGTWPLYATRDVVTPYARTVADLLAILGPLMNVDACSNGDLWRHQRAVRLPAPLADAPGNWLDLAADAASTLVGTRIAIPRSYVGYGDDAGIRTRPSILALWQQAAVRLRSLGAELVLTDFPVVERYEGGVPAGSRLDALGVLPKGWSALESTELLPYGWDAFLRQQDHRSCGSLSQAHADVMFPRPDGVLADRYDAVHDGDDRYHLAVARARAGLANPYLHPDFCAGLRGLELLRASLLDRWMDEHGFDVIAFPANADVGPADAELNPSSADLAWRNGVAFSNGNYAIRHLGIPTLTIPMGVTDDIGMPVGLTFAGRAYADRALLAYALAFEQAGSLREAPPLPHVTSATNSTTASTT